MQKKFSTVSFFNNAARNVAKNRRFAVLTDETGFIPASQSGLPRGAEMDSLVKTTQRFVILEVNEHRRRAVGSIKAVLKAEKDAAKEAFWETAEVGKTYKGEVKSLTSYGAFVDLGGIDGMVHISELSWKRINDRCAPSFL